MLTIDSLRAYGANVDEGMTRCMNNEAFYFRLIGMALKDSRFDTLGVKIAGGDLQAAFEEAHALKGVLGNLALTPIYNSVSEMTSFCARGKTWITAHIWQR
ncbi:MAG: Hpt domain-containing protein [Clostridia bacterium]|nr:Hpt domain-containing protein [Clostridia bacterium]